MALKQTLTDTEGESLPEDIDDLDAAYIKKLKDDGIDPELVSQFINFLQDDEKNQNQ